MVDKNKQDTFLITLVFFAFLFLTYVFYSIGQFIVVDKIYLTLATFLFALFSGFIISRQANRYSSLRKTLADFDGDMSSIYRAFEHFGKDIQARAGEIISEHYENILNNSWDYPLTHKTSTLTNLNALLKEASETYGTDGIKGAVISRILFVLAGAQRARKGMASLYKERTPIMQWFVIYLLAVILAVVVASLDSSFNIIASAVKSAFIISILVVIILLHRLDSLKLFDDTVGKATAEDVINIIKGQR